MFSGFTCVDEEQSNDFRQKTRLEFFILAGINLEQNKREQ